MGMKRAHQTVRIISGPLIDQIGIIAKMTATRGYRILDLPDVKPSMKVAMLRWVSIMAGPSHASDVIVEVVDEKR